MSCTNNKGLTSIDVSQNKDLAFFNCTNCGLTSLSVKGLDNLLDPDAKDRQTLALVRYLVEADRLNKVFTQG